MAVQLRDKIQRAVLRTRCAVHPPFARQQAAVRRVLQPIRQQVFGIMSQPFVCQAFGCRLPVPVQKQAESLVAQQLCHRQFLPRPPQRGRGQKAGQIAHPRALQFPP